MSVIKSHPKALPLAGLGAALAAVLSGCGGATTGGAAGVATPDSSPVIYGLNAQAAVGGTSNETSGLGFTTAGTPASGTTPAAPGVFTGALTAATAFKIDAGPGPIPVYLKNFSTGIPLGFATDGTYLTGSSSQALPTTQAGAVVFRVYVSSGAKGGNSIDINPSSLVLTSSEAPAFTQALTFDGAGIGKGPLGQGQYTTATFALPAALTTSGLHNLHAVVADVAGQKTETDFAVAVVGPNAVALFLQSLNTLTAATATAAAKVTNTGISAGDTVKIDGGAGIGAYPAGYVGTLADAQGTVVLFTTPGTHTLTETDPTGKVVQTETFTLAAATAGTTLLAPPTPDGAPTGSIVQKAVRASRVLKH